MQLPKWLLRRSAKDTDDDGLGIRGAGASSQADFGEPITEADLLFAVKREPMAHRNVFQFSHDIFDKWFEVVEVGKKPDPSFDKAVQKPLSALNTKSVFTQAAIFERLFGWSIIIIGFVDHGKSLADPVKQAQEIEDLAVYSPMSFKVQTSEEDKDPTSPRFGLPIFYTLNRGGTAAQEKVHFSRVIHLATRLIDHAYIGHSVLEAIYDDLTVWRNIRWGMGQTLFRYGSGFPDVTVEGANQKDLDDLEDSKQFESLQARTYFLHNKKTTLDFKGLQGRALDPGPYCNPIMESFSTGTGIPLAVLRGAQAGALTGSEVNEREYFKVISAAQSLYEPFIWQLIDILLETGQIQPKWKRTIEDYEIHWRGGFEINDIDKAAAELNLARAEEIRGNYLTVDELRARMGDPSIQPLGPPFGSLIPGLVKAQSTGFGAPPRSSPSQVSKHNGEGKNEENRDSNGGA
jgi:phage-related protein (TIGR01555 family)